MSADDGIYILHDPRMNTWRVAHAGAIDNFDWYSSRVTEALALNGDSTPWAEPWANGEIFESAKAAFSSYIVSVWGRSKVFTQEYLATAAAMELLKDVEWTEYGISILELPDIPIDWPETEEVVTGPRICKNCRREVYEGYPSQWWHKDTGATSCEMVATPL